MKGYLGIDVSKGYADFTLLDKNRKGLEKVFQLDDTRKGHDKLKALLEKNLKQHGINEIYCGVESTGGLENNWYNSILQWSTSMPVFVVRLNPYGVKCNTQASLQRNVTDALSALYIAEYLIAQGESLSYNKQSNQYSSFRSLHKHINLHKKQNTQIINQLKIVLYSVFPELIVYCRKSIPAWVLEVLKKYPGAQKLAQAKPEQLCKIKHVDMDKAKSIINKAKTSVSSRNHKTDSQLIKQMAMEIQHKQMLIQELKNLLGEQCEGPEIDLLKTIVGVGEYSAAAIMIEIEDIDRFSSPKSMVCFFGLHPELKESGDKKAKYKMSKKGRASMRGTLYMCALTAVMHDAHLKKIYHKHRSKGFNHMQAIGVIMQKLLRIIWGVLTSKSKYNALIDEQNQQKKITKPEDTKREELNSKRRYQELDKEAPISGKQTKTRKVHSESQVEYIDQVRDHQNTPL